MPTLIFDQNFDNEKYPSFNHLRIKIWKTKSDNFIEMATLLTLLIFQVNVWVFQIQSLQLNLWKKAVRKWKSTLYIWKANYDVKHLQTENRLQKERKKRSLPFTWLPEREFLPCKFSFTLFSSSFVAIILLSQISSPTLCHYFASSACQHINIYSETFKSHQLIGLIQWISMMII